MMFIKTDAELGLLFSREGDVKILCRRIHVTIKEIKFFSLEKLNQQIWDLLDSHKGRNPEERSYSRLELFLEDENEKLRSLQKDCFEIK